MKGTRSTRRFNLVVRVGKANRLDICRVHPYVDAPDPTPLRSSPWVPRTFKWEGNGTATTERRRMEKMKKNGAKKEKRMAVSK